MTTPPPAELKLLLLLRRPSCCCSGVFCQFQRSKRHFGRRGACPFSPTLSRTVRGSKKKKAYPETPTPPTVTSTPPKTSTSPTMTSTPLATLTPFPQLPYSDLAPISTPSSSALVVRTSLRPAPLSSTPPTTEDFVDARTLITMHSKSFSKQSDCARLISEIMKQQYVEAHPNFRKVPNNIKNMWYTEFGFDGTQDMTVPYRSFGRNGRRLVTRT
ncbi:hypothetical protein M9H77_07481 [Catharanthus roseus]|uniref:Uncharacterized protein n=1 Tax=Catharanthus roseus TaxID=4058 RepID=A0ACC0BV32_CATRO|nr:hypothetical protein M9H77_07481 [Catharanthus roseus]